MILHPQRKTLRVSFYEEQMPLPVVPELVAV